MKLIVFGANGATGRLVVERALVDGHMVTAVTRNPDSFPIEDQRLTVAYADALDADAVDQVVAGHDRVISTLGVAYGSDDRIYSQGAQNIIAAMARHRLKRFVGVTSIGVHENLAPDEKFIFRKVIGPILLSMGRPLYRDAQAMERIVRATDLDWTIIRPSGLFDTVGVSDYRVAVEPDRIPGMFTARSDLADLIVNEAVNRGHVRQCLEIVTTEGTPSYLSIFLKEALHIGK